LPDSITAQTPETPFRWVTRISGGDNSSRQIVRSTLNASSISDFASSVPVDCIEDDPLLSDFLRKLRLAWQAPEEEDGAEKNTIVPSRLQVGSGSSIQSATASSQHDGSEASQRPPSTLVPESLPPRRGPLDGSVLNSIVTDLEDLISNLRRSRHAETG
jgi:hypothetical protein